jgi:hypothetical protein
VNDASTTLDPATRCVRHPGRVAVDRCPVCERARCAQDVATHAGSGCAVCRTAAALPPPVTSLHLAIAAGVWCLPAVFLGGVIASEYVRDHIFSLIVPALVGVGACWPALVVLHRSGRSAAELRRLTLLVSGFAGFCGVLGTALGFRLDPGGPPQILSPWRLVGLPYVFALLAGLLWPYVYGPPKRPDPEA